eukprot:COSAG01_NODE_1456_length_10254_cov_12.591630_4_plen_77_part_00
MSRSSFWRASNQHRAAANTLSPRRREQPGVPELPATAGLASASWSSQSGRCPRSLPPPPPSLLCVARQVVLVVVDQ